MADFHPLNDPPLQIGERVRIVKAHRSGSDLKGWERSLAGRSGTVETVFERRDAAWPRSRSSAAERRADLDIIVTVVLDPVTPRQRIQHVARLQLASAYAPLSVDVIERLSAPAPAEEEVRRG